MLAARGCDLAEVVSLEGGRVAFWFRQDAVQRQSWRSRLTVGLAAVVVLGLSATALGVSLTLAAQDRLATAEAALARQTARHAALTGMDQATMALLSRKRPDQSLGIMLDHLAEHLPDDSWLEALNITPAGFELSGRSANPEAIIPALEADKSFAAVDFAGSSARDAQSGAFTFAVQGKIAAANGAGP